MPIAQQVLNQLKTFWKTKLDATQLPDDTSAKEAIEKIARLIEIPAGANITFPQAVAAITAFQHWAKITGNEGILSRGLVDAIRRLIMDENDDRTTNTQITKETDRDNEAYWIRYYVDAASLNSFAGEKHILKLCEEAWDLWLQHTANLLVREVEQPGKGVVTVRAGSVGGGAGLSPVLGPGKFNLDKMEVLLDIQEINTSDVVFRKIAAHEFGHIMGIGHLERSGNLMSDVVLDTIDRPQRADIEMAQWIYGAAAPVPPIPPTPPGAPAPGDF
jgi:hypothetical protein